MSLDSQTDSTTRASHWGITINNPTADDRTKLRTQPRWLRMVKGQDEIGANGTLHVQAYANTAQVRMSQLKEWLPRAHFKALSTQQHIANTKDYVHKDETCADVASRFEYAYAQTNTPLTMAEVLTQMAEYAFAATKITDRMAELTVANRKAADPKVVYEEEFWHISRIMLTQNPDLVALLTQPQYMRAWINTRQVWIVKKQVDSQTNITVYPDTPPDSPVALISNDIV